MDDLSGILYIDLSYIINLGGGGVMNRSSQFMLHTDLYKAMAMESQVPQPWPSQSTYWAQHSSRVLLWGQHSNQGKTLADPGSLPQWWGGRTGSLPVQVMSFLGRWGRTSQAPAWMGAKAPKKGPGSMQNPVSGPAGLRDEGWVFIRICTKHEVPTSSHKVSTVQKSSFKWVSQLA